MKLSKFHIFAILALVMHFMAQTTPLWMPKGDGQTIQICTSQGVETYTFDENGAPVKNAPAPKHNCPFCLAQANNPLAAHYKGELPPPINRYVKLNVRSNGITLPASHFSPAIYKRGPPIFS